MKEIIVLGAGPAGMACAMELSNAGKQCSIIEKDNQVGGLAKTLTFKEGKYLFRTDIGPHRFFSKNQYLYDFIGGLLGEEWIVVKRQTRQLIEGKFYDYPINAMQAFKNIGPVRATSMGMSYIIAVVQYKILKKKIKNFDDYIRSNFGKKLGEFNMLNYTEKIWGIPCTKIHADWAKQRIKGLNLISALKNAIMQKGENDGPKTLVDQFYYPQFGTGLIYETISEKIKETGSEIYMKSTPAKIVHKKNKITEVRLHLTEKTTGSKGREKVRETTIKPKQLVSSIPIDQLVKLMSPAPPKKVIKAVNGLKWRAQVYLFLTIDKKRVTKDNWIYFPNKEIPFGRMAEMKNFSKDMSPENKTSLFVEFFVTKGDKIWQLSEKEIYELTLKHLEELKLLTKKDVRKYYVLKRTNVYPVYDLHYLKHLKVIKEYLNQFTNFYYIGRPGRFKYNNQDHSLEMGIIAAKSIIENKRYNFDRIGSEDEYFEKGYVKSEPKKNR